MATKAESIARPKIFQLPKYRDALRPVSNCEYPSVRAIGVILVAGCVSLPLLSPQMETLPVGTPLRAELIKSASVHNGQALAARLTDPVYVGDQLIVPAGTLLQGKIVDLTPDKKKRIRARLNGDFTPFHQTEVRFTSFTLPSGNTFPIETTQAIGASVVRLTAPQVGRHSRSYIRHGWNMAKTDARNAILMIIGPGKAERLEKFAYSQLPYHPEKLYHGVSYGFDLEQPVDVPSQSAYMLSLELSSINPSSNRLHAYLRTPINSRNTKVGTPIEAMVAEPYFDSERSLRIQQGATLLGTVTQARPARWFGRGGKLRFAFRQVRLPEGSEQNIQGIPAAVEAGKQQNLTLDAEGGVKPAPKSKFLLPLLTAYLASYASEGDGGNSVAGDAVASNSLGVIGRIIGIAAGSPKVAMGLGYYAVATSSYDSFVARGRDVTFPRNTRLDIELQPARDNELPRRVNRH